MLGGSSTVSRLAADVKWLVITSISGVLGAEPPNLPLLFSHKQNIRDHASLPLPLEVRKKSRSVSA